MCACASRSVCRVPRAVSRVPRPGLAVNGNVLYSYHARALREMRSVVLLSIVARGAAGLAVPERAVTYGDVARQIGQSLLVVGPVAFGWAAGPLALQPATALRVGLRSARRWGGASVGFTGGRALSQVVRRTDDSWCSIAGAGAAGLLGAPSLGQVPLRVASFVALSYLFESQLLPRLSEATAASSNPTPKKQQKTPVQMPFSGTSGWSLGTRTPWGSRSPWAETSWGRAITRLDMRRQAFEDACVARLLP